MRRFILLFSGLALSLACVTLSAAASESLLMVVMDPLAKPLSCPCVAGYAQRDYEKLAEALKTSLGRDIKLVFNESLVSAAKNNERAPDLVIGKDSVIRHDARVADLRVSRFAMLTGKDGLTTQRGLIVVPTSDAAKHVSDLKDYRVFFGPAECDEKNAAAMRLLRHNGIAIPAKVETAVACDEGAIKILELAGKGERGCAVISSYAKPLLEGCGQVPKGAIRVVGETEDIPFIAAYVNAALDQQAQGEIQQAVLRSTARNFELRIALESKAGFVAADAESAQVAKKK